MAKARQQSVMVLLVGLWTVSQVLFSTPVAEGQLNPFFYSKTCPKLFSIVGSVVQQAIKNESRNAASLLRLHFHDCFVQGCDASNLLDATATIPSEKTALPNLNSLRGFGVIDTIKTALEASCPNVVSCADIVTLAAFFSIVLSNGPFWWVPLGRRDAFQANQTLTANLPGPNSDVPTLQQKFAIQNLTTTDLVALSGAHTIGLARCVVITGRLYNFSNTGGPDPSLNTTLLAALKKSCPQSGDGNVTNNMDLKTPTVFDNFYYQNLLTHNGLFTSDEVLFTTAGDTSTLVNLYAKNQTKFFQDFTVGMTKMGNLHPLTGKAGEIRKNCHVRNSVPGSPAHDPSAEIRMEHSEEAMGLFERTIKNVIREIVGDEVEQLVEDVVGGFHSSS